jgi:hypothetical protein
MVQRQYDFILSSRRSRRAFVMLAGISSDPYAYCAKFKSGNSAAAAPRRIYAIGQGRPRGHVVAPASAVRTGAAGRGKARFRTPPAEA